jgi:hypothetical protein
MSQNRQAADCAGVGVDISQEGTLGCAYFWTPVGPVIESQYRERRIISALFKTSTGVVALRRSMGRRTGARLGKAGNIDVDGSDSSDAECGTWAVVGERWRRRAESRSRRAGPGSDGVDRITSRPPAPAGTWLVREAGLLRRLAEDGWTIGGAAVFIGRDDVWNNERKFLMGEVREGIKKLRSRLKI